jgi:tartrate-resistant acid phosphatase type 5
VRLLPLLALIACAQDAPPAGLPAAADGGGADVDPDPDLDTDGDSAPADGGADGGGEPDVGDGGGAADGGLPDSGDGGATGADSGDTGGKPTVPLRFLAVGDTGTGSELQQEVADAMEAVCDAAGCDFVLLLGDNFYPIGVESTKDSQWDTAFNDIYSAIDVPFYATLGNHDWNIDRKGMGAELDRAQAQVDYTLVSSKWVMDDFYYDFSKGDADFFSIDPVSVDLGAGAPQQAWLDAALLASTATWRVAFGHYPFLSNGPHGNAGSYDGREYGGEKVREFMEESLCGAVDLYLCGHDHSLQWLEDSCGMALVVSGGGSSNSLLGGTNPVWFEESTRGFVWIEIDGRSIELVFYDHTATELYRGGWTK